MNKPADL